MKRLRLLGPRIMLWMLERAGRRVERLGEDHEEARRIIRHRDEQRAYVKRLTEETR